MAKRIGKYKVGSKENTLSAFGDSAPGGINPRGGMKVNVTALGDGISE